MRRLGFGFRLLAAAGGVILSFSVLADPSSLCVSGEDEVFSCVTKSRKTISVCASRGVKKDPARGHVVYRFGRKGAEEIQLLSQNPGSQNSPIFYHYFRPGADRTDLRFDGGKVAYTVFSSYDESLSPDVEAGVIVSFEDDNKKQPVVVHCKQAHRANWILIEGVVGCADEVMNSCEAP